MALIKIKHNNQHNKVAPLVRNGGSRHTGLAALPHKNIQLLYKQSITLLYDLYQNELEKRSLKPDLLSAQEWLRIIRQLMSQEIAKLYLQSYPTPLKIQNHNKNILPGTFTGHLLCAITSILPPTDITNKKPVIAEGTPLYSDFF